MNHKTKKEIGGLFLLSLCLLLLPQGVRSVVTLKERARLERIAQQDVEIDCSIGSWGEKDSCLPTLIQAL